MTSVDCTTWSKLYHGLHLLSGHSRKAVIHSMRCFICWFLCSGETTLKNCQNGHIRHQHCSQS